VLIKFRHVMHVYEFIRYHIKCNKIYIICDKIVSIILNMPFKKIILIYNMQMHYIDDINVSIINKKKTPKRHKKKKVQLKP
jgi:hypothetical protein